MVDVAAVRRDEVLAVGRGDDVILPRREQTQRCGQFGEPTLDRCEAVVEEGSERTQRRAVVGDVETVRVGDVGSFTRHDLELVREQVVDEVELLG